MKFTLEFSSGLKVLNLLNLEGEREGKHMVLESLTYTPYKVFHFIEIPSPKKNKKEKIVELLLGRVTSLDIPISDSSVSRVHSCITYEKGEFYIRDMESKFGTLVRLRYPLAIPRKSEF